MAEQKDTHKIASGAFISPGELQNRPPKPQEDDQEYTTDESNVADKPKFKALWYIIPAIVLIVIIGIIILSKGPSNVDSSQNVSARAKYVNNGFSLKDSSLMLIDRAYYKDDPFMLRQVCENIEKYTQAFTISSTEVPLKEMNSKALVVEVKYSEEVEMERDLSFIITDPKGKERPSSKQTYAWKTEETIFVNLDSFFEKELLWESGTWNITVLTNEKEIVSYTITIVD